MAEFFPAAALITDENGEAGITMGIGDVRLRAWSGGCVYEKMVFPAQEAGARDSGLKEKRTGEIRTELVLKSGYPFIQEEDAKGRLAGGNNTWEPVSRRNRKDAGSGGWKKLSACGRNVSAPSWGSCPQGNSLKRRKCCKSPGKMRRSCTPS